MEFVLLKTPPSTSNVKVHDIVLSVHGIARYCRLPQRYLSFVDAAVVANARDP